MSVLRDFELQAIRLMAADTLSADQLAALGEIPIPARYEYTGAGYFLTVHHPLLPQKQQTLSSPAVAGDSGDVRCGFVVFLGDHELVLECHTWGEVDVPADMREREVTISTPPVNVVDLR